MNPKIDKLARDIEKTEKKIADLQKKLELFKEEKTCLLYTSDAADEL